MKRKVGITLLLSLIVSTGCDDLHDKEIVNKVTATQETAGLYILSEGLFNMNNSTLAYYDFKTQKLETDYFLLMNQRGLGDTANDIKLYGSKLYIVVNVSSQIEVLDVHTGVCIKRIPLFSENNIAQQPRYITFHEDKAYVCSFDGTVAKIDTASLQLEGFTKVGRHPDGLCVQNGKLYVSNSGGLDYPNYDNTVSVVDLATFKEIKKITVRINPYKIHADAYGDVYVVSRGNYGTIKYCLQRIDSRTDELVQTFDNLEVLNFAIEGDNAYLYSYDFYKATAWIKVFNVRTERVERENFITDDTKIDTPYGIDVNPVNGDVYITNAYSFTVWGDLLCFTKEGKLKFTLSNIGLNPNGTVFIQKNSSTEE